MASYNADPRMALKTGKAMAKAGQIPGRQRAPKPAALGKKIAKAGQIPGRQRAPK